jgi:hypothetical protein
MVPPTASKAGGGTPREPPAPRCTIRNCPEAAEQTFTTRVGRIKVLVPLCAHHVKVAFAPDGELGRRHHPLPMTSPAQGRARPAIGRTDSAS